MPALETDVDRLASETAFSGVVRVDRGGRVEVAKAYGLARRGDEVPNSLDTRFAIASGTKGLTALTVVSLVEDGLLELSTPIRSFLGDTLPLVRDDVTVEHLLAHRSGIGDYLDEDEPLDLTDYLMPVPVRELATTDDYLRILDGHPAKFGPGARFSYSNSGYVLLAAAVERATGEPFHEVVRSRVCGPARLEAMEFLRSDELPERTAVGYLASGGLRTNLFHLPVRGSGDGGVYTTVADVRALWEALFAGRIVAVEWVAELTRPRSETPNAGLAYGLGFWLDAPRRRVILEGADAGVSFRSIHVPHADATYTMISNATAAWPLARLLDEIAG